MNNSMGGDSGTTSGMSMPVGSRMVPWLHVGNADPVLFEAWRPSSRGAVAGACVGLFLFCVLERALAAHRRAHESRWGARAALASKAACASASEVEVCYGDSATASGLARMPPAFGLVHDVLRGVLQAVQSTCSFAIMLVVMTYNGAYIISIILGLGVGEAVFGRIGRGREGYV